MFGRQCSLRRPQHLDCSYLVAYSVSTDYKPNEVAHRSIVRFPYLDRPNGAGLPFGCAVVYVLKVPPRNASTLKWDSPIGYN